MPLLTWNWFSRVEHVERVEGFDRIDRIEKRFLAVVSLEFEV